MQMRNVLIMYSRVNERDLNQTLPPVALELHVARDSVTLPVEIFKMREHFLTLFPGKAEKECSSNFDNV